LAAKKLSFNTFQQQFKVLLYMSREITGKITYFLGMHPWPDAMSSSLKNGIVKNMKNVIDFLRKCDNRAEYNSKSHQAFLALINEYNQLEPRQALHYR
jgi:hypothetical protein